MRCYNQIVVAYYHNGKSKVIGSTGIVHKFSSINGYYADEICDGIIECEIFLDEHDDFGRGIISEIGVKFQCNKCGKIHQLDYSIEDIQTIVTNTI